MTLLPGWDVLAVATAQPSASTTYCTLHQLKSRADRAMLMYFAVQRGGFARASLHLAAPAVGGADVHAVGMVRCNLKGQVPVSKSQ
jgi:hypothetical protein